MTVFIPRKYSGEKPMLDDGSQQDVETRSVEAKGVGLGRAIEFLSTPA